MYRTANFMRLFPAIGPLATGSEARKIENGKAGARNDLKKVHRLLMTFGWAATRSTPPTATDALSTPELRPKPSWTPSLPVRNRWPPSRQ